MKSIRQNQLINLLQQNKIVNTKEIAEHFNVSIETIRRDLDQLEKQGIINKRYGGAELVPQTKIMPSPLVTRRVSCKSQKAAIAAKAAEHIPNRCTIALDAGSTINELCPYLNEKEDLIIVCSDLHTAVRLLGSKSNKVYMMGGFLTPDGTSNGTFAKEFFTNISRIDVFVCATDGANPEEGLSCDETGINELKKRYLRKARTTIAVMDNSKFMHSGFYKTCDFQDLDLLITDSQTPEDVLTRIERTGLKIEVVDC